MNLDIQFQKANKLSERGRSLHENCLKSISTKPLQRINFTSEVFRPGVGSWLGWGETAGHIPVEVGDCC